MYISFFSSPAYTFAVAGNDASITSHSASEDEEDDPDTVLYFDMDYSSCDPSANIPTSFMTAKFNYFVPSGPDDTSGNWATDDIKTVCWKAPSKYILCMSCVMFIECHLIISIQLGITLVITAETPVCSGLYFKSMPLQTSLIGCSMGRLQLQRGKVMPLFYLLGYKMTHTLMIHSAQKHIFGLLHLIYS